MSEKFPRFKTHDDASCFNCGGDLYGEWWSASGYPHGRGAFFCECRKCGMKTWYDLETEEQAFRSMKETGDV